MPPIFGRLEIKCRGMTMHRIVRLLMSLWLALWVTTTGVSSQPNDVVGARKLFGTWQWLDKTPQGVAYHRLQLMPDFAYFWTDWDDFGHLVEARGTWTYAGGWLMFQSQWSQPRDPTGAFLVQGPIRVLEVGSDYVRTPAGVA